MANLLHHSGTIDRLEIPDIAIYLALMPADFFEGLLFWSAPFLER